MRRTTKILKIKRQKCRKRKTKLRKTRIPGQLSQLARNPRAREEDVTRKEFDPGIITDLTLGPAAVNDVDATTY